MALTINNFWGAETGGLEEANATSATLVSAVSTPTQSGGWAYETGSGFSDSSWIDLTPFESVADAGGSYVVGFGVRLKSATPALAANLFDVSDTTGIFLSLYIELDDDLVIRDANSAPIRTITAPFTLGVWYFVEVYFDHSATGTVEVFIDGVSQGEDTGQDLTNGGTVSKIRVSSRDQQTTYFDDIYFMSGATASSDRLGPVEVFAYRSSEASVTADWTKGANGDLNSGTWANVQEVPFSDTNVALYSDTTARAGGIDTNDVGGSAGTGGPNTDTNIDGDANIVAMKGIWRMMRSGGSGSVHYGLMGNTGTAIADTDRTIDLAPTTGYLNYFDVREDNLPLSTEYGRIGFEKDNKGQDFDCGEMLFQILHVPTPAASAPAIIYSPYRAFQHLLMR